MAAEPGSSLFISLVLTVLAFCCLQVFAQNLGASNGGRLAGGFISSVIFMLTLTAIGNIEQLINRNAKTKWIEVVLALFVALISASTVHGVSVTSCVLFSGAILFYLNKVSQLIYETDKSAPTVSTSAAVAEKKGKKKQ